MNEAELKESADRELVIGTTCANCLFTKDQMSTKVIKGDLNKFGGITPTTESDIKNAKAADVITMPGEKFPTKKHMCSNPLVAQWVTERMCCNLWDHPGIIRNFTGKEPRL
jgi:hypothetical protein